MQKQDKYEMVSELARRRGFFWPSYEIYGGVSGFLTYGPLGTALKQRIERKFRNFFMKKSLNILEMESSVITPATIFEASGHVKAFREPMVKCLKCKRNFRADHLLQEQSRMSDTETERFKPREIDQAIKKHKIICPECNGKLSKTKHFMTMFTTTIGPYSNAVGYGRPEAAQGAFVEFKRLYEAARGKFPFGVAQIGHALRNEISPRQGLIRLREFTIADIEFFFDPEEPQCSILKNVENETLNLIPAELKQKNTKKTVEVAVMEALDKGYIKTDWQAYFMILAKQFLNDFGVPNDKQRFIEKLDWERAHYSQQGYDQEIYLDRWGWTEVSGHNYRTNYDLKSHMEHSGVDLQIFKEFNKPTQKVKMVVEPILEKIGPTFRKNASKVVTLLLTAEAKQIEKSLKEKGYYDMESFKILPEHIKLVRKKEEETGRRFIPHVVEPSFGIDRLVYVVLEFAYNTKENRTLLKLPRDLAPVQAGVYPLVIKDGIAEKAQQLHGALMKEGFLVEYDEAGSIGRRYARADEVGTPLCITIDYQTLENNTVTIRDRDSWDQIRIDIEKLPKSLWTYFYSKKDLKQLGE